MRSSVELGLARSWLTRALLHRGMCLRAAVRSNATHHEETVTLSSRVFDVVIRNYNFLIVDIISFGLRSSNIDRPTEKLEGTIFNIPR